MIAMWKPAVSILIAVCLLSSTSYSLNPEETKWRYADDQSLPAFDTRVNSSIVGDPESTLEAREQALATAERILEWAVTNGAYLDHRLSLRLAPGAEQGIGWFASDDIPPESELIRVPKKLMITEAVLTRSALSSIFKANPILLSHEHGLVAYGFAVYVIYCSQTQSCPHRQFAQSLRPSRAHALMQPLSDIHVMLKNNFAYEDLSSVKETHEALWRNLQQPVFANPDLFASPVTETEFTRVVAAVAGHLVYKDVTGNPTTALIPLIHYLNHGSDENIAGVKRPRSKYTWQFVNKHSVAGGDQVLGNYGDMSSAEFYKRYGFIPRPGPKDVRVLDAGVPENAALYKEKLTLLEEFGISTSLEFTRDGVIPEEILSYFRILIPDNKKELDMVKGTKARKTSSRQFEQDVLDRVLFSLFQILDKRQVLTRDISLLTDDFLPWYKRPLAQLRLSENQIFMSAVTSLKDMGGNPPPKTAMTFVQAPDEL